MVEAIKSPSKEGKKIPEPIKLEIHATTTAKQCCLVAFQDACDELGSSCCIEGDTFTRIVHAEQVRPTQSVCISKPLPKDLAETLRLLAQTAGDEGHKFCGCDGVTNFKLVEMA
jgi:hypothetical protein